MAETPPAMFTFLFASLLLAATPGPGVLYILARTLAQGRGAGLASVAGVALGNLANALGASLGLAALFALHPPALALVKYAGALYLVYLGCKTLAAPLTAATTTFATARRAQILRDGFVVALLNPKTALFFAAFLPQFIDPASAAMPQTLCLGSLFVLLAACTDTLYVLTAGAVGPLLARRRAALIGARYLLAMVLIGLGLLAAASGSPAP